MTPEAFIAKWRDATLKERSAAQEHFIDICRLLGEPTPAEADPKGEWYAFEFGAKKSGGGNGWADVWRRACFGWEYKGKGKSLTEALRQLLGYTPALLYPPLLIVSDIDTIEIHTAFPNTVSEKHRITLDDLRDPANRQLLKWAFTDPERLRPHRTRNDVTAEAAARLGGLAEALCQRGHEPRRVAHFINQCLFCLYAEDVGLLPTKLFERIVEKSAGAPDKLTARLGELFQAMQQGGDFLLEDIDWFNGGLFERIDLIPLVAADIQLLREAARMDWTAIEPSIFGTLFERGLDPAKRSQLGAHYTDPDSILRIIRPVILEPLQAEWATAKAVIQADQSKQRKKAHAALQTFLERLKNFRVLDPACGSGNFLYLALRTLKDLEHQVMLEAEALGLPRGFPQVGPEVVMGIELNPYAAELARVTVWIGEIQWMLAHGFNANRNPVLRPLDTIRQQDAVVNPDGAEPEWPPADAIIGNPPFLGDKKMLAELGEEYVTRLRGLYKGRVPGGADLVTYWFERARAQIAAGQTARAGLVSTNSIRQKRNRAVLERVIDTSRIFEAWSDLEWVNEGAAVRVSLVCFGNHPGGDQPARLDGQPVSVIHADLTGQAEGAQTGDLTQAQPLPANKDRSFFGVCLAGPFKVDTATALAWLKDTGNPNGRPNSDVVRPIYNGSDITRRWAGNWVVDFGGMEQAEAADYLAPFAHVEQHVRPTRINNNRAARAARWWQHGEKRPALRRALQGLTHYIATPETAKHRFFVRFPVTVAPEHSLIVIPRQDDATLGILSSRHHCAWALAKGGRMGMGNDPRYNATLTFETFPFPPGFDLQAEAPANPAFNAIAEAARALLEWRENWLNPKDWVEWAQTPEEQAAGLPSRPQPRPDHAADWKKRTLTNLYNENPSGLKLRHQALDAAVAAAYGWVAELSNDEILRRLLALNRERAG